MPLEGPCQLPGADVPYLEESLAVATALIFMLLAIPMGQLADRIGRGRVFVGGYAVLMGVYGAAVTAGVIGLRRRNRPLPDVRLFDIALVGLARLLG